MFNRIQSGVFMPVCAALVRLAKHESLSKDKLQLKIQKNKAKQENMDMKSFFMKNVLSQFKARGMAGP